MHFTMLVMRQEIRKTLQSTGYVIFSFIVPVVAVLVLAVVRAVQDGPGAGATASAPSPAQFEMDVEGYVDQSGLIQVIPGDFPPGHLLAYENEEQAQQALAAGEISAYYLIPPDYLERGEVDYVYPDTRSYLDDGQPWVMDRTLTLNLLAGDFALADRVWNPVWNVRLNSISPQAPGRGESGEDCSRPSAACESNDLVRYMPSIIVALFFIAFMTSSSRLFNSIGTEKENRTIEVLMLSVSPRQLLAGKTLGLGIAGLLQTAVWLGAIYFAFNLGGRTLRLPEGFVFPVDILIWGVVFFLGGFGLYASLMAGAGALVPKMKEAGVANFIAMIPLFFGYMFGLMAPLAEATESAFLVFLSFLPLTSPIVMVMRVTAGVVPFWQLGLSALLLFVSACYTLQAVAAMFHAQNLLSGQPFSLGRYFKALLGKG